MKKETLVRMIDLSLLKPDHNIEDVRKLVSFAREHKCIAVFTLPAFIPDVVTLLEGDREINVGGPVGFPSGGEMSSVKIAQTKEMIKAGCTEIDMVVNVGFVKSGRYTAVSDDIKGVVEAAQGTPVKIIFECHYLNDDEKRKLCEISCDTGAEYIKTSTGWAPTGAAKEDVALMKSVVEDRIKIKAAGGIRDLQTIEDLYAAGAVRFGVGLDSADSIFKEMEQRRT